MSGYLVTPPAAHEIMDELSPKSVYRLGRIHMPLNLGSNLNVLSGMLWQNSRTSRVCWLSGTL